MATRDETQSPIEAILAKLRIAIKGKCQARLDFIKACQQEDAFREWDRWVAWDAAVNRFIRGLLAILENEAEKETDETKG